MELEATITERRRQTRSSIYRHLYAAKGFCSKQSRAYDLGLSLPTVYQNLTDLMDAGLVRYSGEQRSTSGRKAMGLDIVPDARIAVGVSITEDRLRFAATDLRLQEIAYKKVYHEPINRFPGFKAFLLQELERFLDEKQIDRTRLLGVGIALPAVISPDSEQITLVPTLQLRDFTLRGLTENIPYPVYIENDATSGDHAEWFMRAGQRNMAYLSLENGVGGSVLGQRSPLHRRQPAQRRIRSYVRGTGGLPCKCGKRGCLEAYCSARRISDDLGITLKDFFAGIEQHNPEYEALWHDVLHHLAIGINNIHMTLNCDVVLGGFLNQYLPRYLPLLREYVAACDPFDSNADYLHLSTLRRHSVPLGVALHFVDEFLEHI